jgi:uncharacterized protein YneF (UPF0154 family)
MKLMLAIFTGFVASILAAIVIGFCIGMAFPMTVSSSELYALYATESVGVVVSITVGYYLGRGAFKRLTGKESQYTERLA